METNSERGNIALNPNSSSREISENADWNLIIDYQRRKIEEIRQREIQAERLLQDLRDDQERQSYIIQLYEQVGSIGMEE